MRRGRQGGPEIAMDSGSSFFNSSPYLLCLRCNEDQFRTVGQAERDRQAIPHELLTRNGAIRRAAVVELEAIAGRRFETLQLERMALLCFDRSTKCVNYATLALRIPIFKPVPMNSIRTR